MSINPIPADREKIAVPSSAPGGLDAQVNPRFGRCEFLTIITLQQQEIIEINVVQNQGSSAMGGAGSLASQLVAKEGAGVVIGGNYGPNAAFALNQAGIKTFGYPSGMPNVTVKQVLDLYIHHQIPEIAGANTPSHSGLGQNMGGGGGFGHRRQGSNQ